MLVICKILQCVWDQVENYYIHAFDTPSGPLIYSAHLS